MSKQTRSHRQSGASSSESGDVVDCLGPRHARPPPSARTAPPKSDSIDIADVYSDGGESEEIVDTALAGDTSLDGCEPHAGTMGPASA